jgi:hypothetical protein
MAVVVGDVPADADTAALIGGQREPRDRAAYPQVFEQVLSIMLASMQRRCNRLISRIGEN